MLSPVLLLLLAASTATAQKKDSDKEKPQTKEKIASSGKFVAKLISAENTTRNFTVQVEFYEPDQNKVLANSQYDAQRRIEMAAIRNNPAEKQKQFVAHLYEMKKRERDMYKKSAKNYDLVGEEEIKVRTMVLPINYDEKGKPKKYTKKELAEMKGPNKKLPGYTAEFDSLHKDQKVRVYLAKQKKKTRPKNKDKEKDKEKDKDSLDDRLPVVMVVILEEPPMKDK
jgi:hypothetical protein